MPCHTFMQFENYLRVGQIGRPKGKEGLMLASLENPLKTQPKWVFIKIDGHLLPYRVSKWEETPQDLELAFEGISSRHQAAQLKGLTLFLPQKSLLKFPPPAEALIGYFVKTATVKLGKIEAVLARPLQPLLRLNAEGKILLIPWVSKWVTKWDQAAKTIQLKLPPGYLEACAS